MNPKNLKTFCDCVKALMFAIDNAVSADEAFEKCAEQQAPMTEE